MSVKKKVVYRNIYTGTTFIVVGDPAVERMDALASWVR